jgi:multiphosphoryl transfer protein
VAAGDHPTATLSLRAPLTGQMVPIEQVPDPVFAQRMVGDGVSIDPLTDRLLAPCDGEVIQLHPAGHAVTILSPEGIEVMLHIGLDTVMLKGEGFSPQIQVGDRVSVGTELIAFDLDQVAVTAKSLLTQVVITNSERLTGLEPATGIVAAGQDVIAEISFEAEVADEGSAGGAKASSDAIVIPNPTGLHARPAAVLANLAKSYDSTIKLQRGDAAVNAKSTIAIMGLEVDHGDKVTLLAEGPDADEAVKALAGAIADGLGEEGTPPAPAPASVSLSDAAAPAPRPRSDDPNLLLGASAAPGLAVGTVVQVRHDELSFPEDAKDPHKERRRLDDAIDKAMVQLEALEARLQAEADPDKAAIFAAHQELLDDPDLLDLAGSAINKGRSAEYAWHRAYTRYADQLAGLSNQLLAQRAADVRDVGQRVIEILTGVQQGPPEYPAGSILVAEDLTPSDTATLDRERVGGFATTAGGASSHVAILARSLDIAAVAGIEPRALDIPDGTRVILDGTKGSLRLNATDDEVARVERRLERLAERRAVELEHAHEPAITTDGHRVEVVANIGDAKDARDAMEKGAEGVGLLRSEFVFLDRPRAPSEDEQADLYQEIAAAVGGDRPLVIRTLDVGGDKPLAYLPIAREDNPFLGERGIRVGLDRPEILRTQVRAILRAADAGARLHVMFPMIATIPEWRAARGVFEEESQRLGVGAVPLGIMVEVPSVAVMAPTFAAEVDFFSIGSNDLTQYTLAMDRGHPKLAPQVDGLNPAVLRLIQLAVDAAHDHGKWVGVCGGIAADPQAVPLLVGLGVDELSVSIPTIPSVKAQIRSLSLADSKTLAAEALTQDTAAAVRALVPVDRDGEESVVGASTDAIKTSATATTDASATGSAATRGAATGSAATSSAATGTASADRRT